MKIAIIGAGVSGGFLARALTQAGMTVEVYEKARGPGGRTATRRFSLDGTDYFIDHGAQYIDVDSVEFQSFIDEMKEAGVVASCGDTNVATPNMNSLAKHLFKDIKVYSAYEVTNVDEIKAKYDLVISTAPPKQTAAIFQGYENFASLAQIEMKPHFALMLITESDYDFGFEQLGNEDFKVKESILNWIGICTTKPGRDKGYQSIVMHTDFQWTQANLDKNRDEILELALEELEKITGFKDPNPIYKAHHRWLYGRTLEPLGKEFIYDEENNLACCGDYMLGDNIEAAFLSASALAAKIKTINHELTRK